MNKITIKIVSIIAMTIIILNMILMVLGRIDPLMFWFIIIVIGLFAYKGIPILAKRVRK